MIKTEGLTKIFDKYIALNNVDCTIDKGCICGIVGSNGAGKSTFLRLLAGVYKADKGSIYIDDMPVFDNPDIKAKIAYVPDELYFISNATIENMMELYASIYPDYNKEKCLSLAAKLKLNPKQNVNTFSKGMKRQAATILALAAETEYIFFDETFDGLDPVIRNFVKSIICEEVYERKATAIITSHSLRELEDICDQLALLHKGGLILQSDIDNLKTSHCKIQMAFSYDYDETLFNHVEHLRFKKTGSVSSMIVKGNLEDTKRTIEAMNPILLDILPLTLEEVFSYEMETLAYNFDVDLSGKEV